jgi:hypothetical protein
VSRRLTFCFLHSGRCCIAGTVGCCCALLRQSDICIGGWDWRSWTRVSNCALVFYSPESLERLANAQTFFIFMDGTFSLPPHPFKQLYTIRIPFKGVTGTAVYAFLPNKCQDTYRERFQSIV